MGFVKACYRLLFGTERQHRQNNNQQPTGVSLPAGRKRSLEEEEQENNLELNKNSLNRPVKRARMEDLSENAGCDSAGQVVVQSPLRKIIRSFKSFFVGSQVRTGTLEEAGANEEGGEGNQFNPDVETVDLTEEDDENKENLPVPDDSLQPQSSTLASLSSASTLATLSSFGGFTAATFSSLSGPGHVVTTSRETHRRQEANSPEKVKMRLAGGGVSRYDNFFSEKDIAKRIWRKPSELGRVVKSGKKRLRNAFQHEVNLQEKEKYRMMLERYGVVRYSAHLDRVEDLRPFKTSSLLKPGPLKASQDLVSEVARVDDTVDAKSMLTSTVVKPGLSSPTSLELAASPVLPRDKSSLYQSPARPTREDTELAAVVTELTSPEFLESLHKKYGAKAREREMQIQREEGRKRKCEKDTEDVISMIDERLQSHLKITQAAVDESLVKDSEFDESQPTELPPLTSEMTAVIRRAQASRGEVLVDAHKISITVKDIDTLKGLNWLNDEIINFYMQMIVERASGSAGQFPSVHAFTTFFYPRLMEKGYTAVKRWTKKVDIFSFSLLIIPVHLGMHWCLAVIDIDRQAITYYDSMGGNNKVTTRLN